MPASLNKYLDPAALDETVVNIRELIEVLEAEMQDLPYARPDGIYPDMTVGAVIGADETAQWATRESTGTGSATVRSVQGVAVGWNQLIKLINTVSPPFGVTITLNPATGLVTLNGTTTNSGGRNNYIATNIPWVAGHKYLILDTINYSSGNTTKWVVSDTTTASFVAELLGGNIYTATTDHVCWIGKNFASAGEVYDCSGYVSLYDLTQMFGSGNEPATAAEFERMYPASYYPYSAPTLKPVQIAGIASTDAQGGELDSVEWDVSTYFPDGMWGVGDVRDKLTEEEAIRWFNGTVDLGTLNWSTMPTETADVYRLAAAGIGDVALVPTSSSQIAAICAVPFTTGTNGDTYQKKDKTISLTPNTGSIVVYDSSYNQQDSAAAFKAAMSGVILHYATKEPIVTPISPALPTTYRVEQGGTESIIVPTGEVSAAPVLTVAEPVNAGDEFARIWAAIQSLGYTRNTAQLSRPVSLTDIGSIDEVQKDTTDVVEIDTTKEVTE